MCLIYRLIDWHIAWPNKLANLKKYFFILSGTKREAKKHKQDEFFSTLLWCFFE